MIIDMKALGGLSSLSGALSGAKCLARLLADTSTEPTHPEIVLLDFQAIELATASFLRECVMTFRDVIRRRRSNFYPIVANANQAIREELGVLTEMRNDVLMVCAHTDGVITAVTLIGTMDPKQRMTFDLVQEKETTDASELMREYGEAEGTKHSTAWNNRLSALANLSLVFEISEGRTKRYKRMFERDFAHGR